MIKATGHYSVENSSRLAGTLHAKDFFQVTYPVGFYTFQNWIHPHAIFEYLIRYRKKYSFFLKLQMWFLPEHLSWFYTACRLTYFGKWKCMVTQFLYLMTSTKISPWPVKYKLIAWVALWRRYQLLDLIFPGTSLVQISTS